MADDKSPDSSIEPPDRGGTHLSDEAFVEYLKGTDKCLAVSVKGEDYVVSYSGKGDLDLGQSLRMWEQLSHWVVNGAIFLEEEHNRSGIAKRALQGMFKALMTRVDEVEKRAAEQKVEDETD